MSKTNNNNKSLNKDLQKTFKATVINDGFLDVIKSVSIEELDEEIRRRRFDSISFCVLSRS